MNTSHVYTFLGTTSVQSRFAPVLSGPLPTISTPILPHGAHVNDYMKYTVPQTPRGTVKHVPSQCHRPPMKPNNLYLPSSSLVKQDKRLSRVPPRAILAAKGHSIPPVVTGGCAGAASRTWTSSFPDRRAEAPSRQQGVGRGRNRGRKVSRALRSPQRVSCSLPGQENWELLSTLRPHSSPPTVSTWPVAILTLRLGCLCVAYNALWRLRGDASCKRSGWDAV